MNKKEGASCITTHLLFLLQVSMDLLGAQSIINGDCSCIFPYMANTVLHHATGRFE